MYSFNLLDSILQIGFISKRVDIDTNADSYLFVGSGISYYKEKFTLIDNEKRVKEAEIIEGGFLDFGFTLYRVRFEVKDNPNDNAGSSCLVKTTIEYEVKEEHAANASFVTMEPFVVLMKFANEHLLSSS